MFKKRNRNDKVINLLESEMTCLRETMRECKKMKELHPEHAEHYQAQYEVYRLKLHQTEFIYNGVRGIK